MKHTPNISISRLFVLSILTLTFTYGCKEPENQVVPVLTTLPVTDITFTKASSGGNITNTGGSDISLHGVCWSSENKTPSLSDSITDGIGTTTFSSNITGLNVNTTYYVRAFATNITGTGYGDTLSFKTASITVPVDILLYPNTVDSIPVQGYKYLTAGKRGILIYRFLVEEFMVYERTCPYDPEKDCSRIEIDASGSTVTDLCCGSRYLLIDGTPFKGPAHYRLQQYQWTYNGETLHIFNSK